MQDQDLWRLSASALAALTQKGEVSATEAVMASLARMDALNPTLNAVVIDLRD